MVNPYIEMIFIYGFCTIIAVLFLMILFSWGYGFSTKNWTPYEKTVALLALLIGNLHVWHLFITTIGETTDAPKI
jgi:hypothetical protein